MTSSAAPGNSTEVAKETGIVISVWPWPIDDFEPRWLDFKPFGTQAFGSNAGGAPGKAQSAATPRRRAWRVAACRGFPASDHRRRRVGQDLDAGAPRRLPDRAGRRSSAHHAAHILAACRGGNDAAGRSHPDWSHAGAGRRDCRDHGCSCEGRLGRHVPRHRCAAVARICGNDRARTRLHHPRSRGFRRI